MTQTIISFNKNNLQNLKPFSSQTENTLKKHIFKSNQLEGRCADLNSFAKRVSTLKSLQSQLDNGEIDLGKRDRLIAIAKCVGAALLTAVFVLVWATPFILHPPFTAAWPVMTSFLSGFGIVGSGCLLEKTCKNAFKVFQRPSPEQLKEELAEKENAQFSNDNISVLKNIEQELFKKQQKCEGKITNRPEIDRKTYVEQLLVKKELLEQARTEISQMLKALENENNNS